MKDQVYVTTQYKDTLFRMLFKEKQKLLELYNAINNTSYKNPDDLDVVTLEIAVYMSIKTEQKNNRNVMNYVFPMHLRYGKKIRLLSFA